jgi:hypothetical protein
LIETTILETTVETNPEMSIDELRIEVFVAIRYVPEKSQFYEWLKASWVMKPQKRGGRRTRSTYSDKALRRLIRLGELVVVQGKTLNEARNSLFEEIKQNQDYYLD